MGQRLDYIETRLNTDNVKTRSDIALLENFVSELNLTYIELRDKVQNHNGEYPPDTKLISNGHTGDVYGPCDWTKDRKALFQGFAAEKKLLKNEISRSKSLIYSLRESLAEDNDKLKRDHVLLYAALKELSDLVKTQQSEIVTLRLNYQTIIEDNEQLRKELNDTKVKILDFEDARMTEVVNTHHGSCPDGWKLFKNHCYQFDNNKDTVAFVTAKTMCENDNAYIADFSSRAESEFIRNMTGLEQVWVGVTDIETEGVWISERTQQAIEYSDWYDRDPDGGKGQNCVITGWIVSPPSKWHEWIDINCSKKHKFVCKMNATF